MMIFDVLLFISVLTVAEHGSSLFLPGCGTSAGEGANVWNRILFLCARHSRSSLTAQWRDAAACPHTLGHFNEPFQTVRWWRFQCVCTHLNAAAAASLRRCVWDRRLLKTLCELLLAFSGLSAWRLRAIKWKTPRRGAKLFPPRLHLCCWMKALSLLCVLSGRFSAVGDAPRSRSGWTCLECLSPTDVSCSYSSSEDQRRHLRSSL